MDHLRNRHFFLVDLLLLPLAAYASYVLRLEAFQIDIFWPSFAIFALLMLILTPFFFKRVGVYSRYWRYASIEELLLLSGAIAASTVIASLIAWPIIDWLPGKAVLPRSIPFIFLPLGLAATAGPRLALRMLSGYDWRRGRSNTWRPVAIMGAGDAGAMILRELQRNPHLGMEVVGFLDDDTSKFRMHIHGVPVLGGREMIPRLARNSNINLIIIAMPTAPGREIRDLVRLCEEAGLETKIIPGMYELLDGTVSVNQLRDVNIEDLLRREPIKTNIAAVMEALHGKRVLVTGGGGSIGSELCRQVLRCQPAELTVLGHGENAVFETMEELTRIAPPAVTLTGVIADIRFPERLQSVFDRFQPEIVFHAAAHKHVPLMEANPAEAVTNNVLGTSYLLRVARASGVERFVMISTDKAVNPTSLMGASKRVAELLVQREAEESGLPFVTVRFGNVLGSRGSVIHTFKNQIDAGGPVTVTDPEVRRYFMTIPEAVQLVLQASVLGRGGEIFVLDMGEPLRIVDLARDLIELSGLEPGRDIEVVFTGLRPGEKLFEELFASDEAYRRTEHHKIFIAHTNGCGNVSSSKLDKALESLTLAARCNNRAEIVSTLQQLLPEFEPLDELVAQHSRQPAEAV